MSHIRNLRSTISCLKIYNLKLFERHILIKNKYRNVHHSCKLLVVGGGTGGCSMAAKFVDKFKGQNQIIIIEPNEIHYYQPMFTLIGGGIRSFEDSKKPMKDTLPKKCKMVSR